MLCIRTVFVLCAVGVLAAGTKTAEQRPDVSKSKNPFTWWANNTTAAGKNTLASDTTTSANEDQNTSPSNECATDTTPQSITDPDTVVRLETGDAVSSTQLTALEGNVERSKTEAADLLHHFVTSTISPINRHSTVFTKNEKRGSGESTQMTYYNYIKTSITSPPQQSQDRSENILVNNSETYTNLASDPTLPVVFSKQTRPGTTNEVELTAGNDKNTIQKHTTAPVTKYPKTQQITRNPVNQPVTQQSTREPVENSLSRMLAGHSLEPSQLFQSTGKPTARQQTQPSAKTFMEQSLKTRQSTEDPVEQSQAHQSTGDPGVGPQIPLNTMVRAEQPQETQGSTEGPVEGSKKEQVVGNSLQSSVFVTAPHQTQQQGTERDLTTLENTIMTPSPAAALSRTEFLFDSNPPQDDDTVPSSDGTLVSSGTTLVWLFLSACNPNKIYRISHPTTMVFVRGENVTSFRSCRWTITAPEECGLKVRARVKYEVKDPERTAHVQVMEEAHPENVQTYCTNCVEGFFNPIFTESLDLGEFLFIYRTSDKGSEQTDFWIVMSPVTPMLEVNYTRPNVSGYIMSNGLGRWDSYYHDQNASAFIPVPANHVVLISFPLFMLEEANKYECSFDSLSLYEEPGGNMIWRRCGSDFFPLEVYSHSLRFQFITDDGVERKGFKLYFTVLPEDQAPVRLDNGLFDCAVPHYCSFSKHIRCNLVQDCEGGEDESDCPYSTEECPGMITAGEKCYSYLQRKSNFTWYEAYTECREQDLDLVKLKKPGDLEAFKGLVSVLLEFPFLVFMGLRTPQTAAAAVPALYKEVWQWSDKTMAYYVHFSSGYERMTAPACSIIVTEKERSVVRYTPCNTRHTAYLVCEKKQINAAHSSNLVDIKYSFTNKTTDPKPEPFSNDNLAECPDGHMTHNFLSCDPSTKCGTVVPVSECSVPGAGTVPMFTCDNEMQTIHYSLVCDHRRHCSDGSDEDFCVFPQCDQNFECRNQQCLPHSQVCDGMQHCVDNSDEDCAFELTGPRTNATPPAIVHFDDKGRYNILNTSQPCPETHFQCSNGLCLPMFVRCNGMDDCLGREDELHCDTYTCPGFYRCRGSSVCLHVNHVCDGVYQCPEQDDELFCNISCPAGCVCQGLAFICSKPFPVEGSPDLRFLDGHGSGMRPSDFQSSFFLVGLKLSKCKLKSVGHISNENLQYLDLSKNLFSHVHMNYFSGLKNLKVLVLSGNPMYEMYGGDPLQRIPNLHTVDISMTNVEIYDSQMFVNVPGLLSLNMSHSKLRKITQTGFNTTALLETLDLRESHLRDYPFNMLMGLSRLKTLYTDDFRLCCRATLPEHFDLKNCHTQMDDIASCEDLLRSNVYRVFLWVFASLALLGNAGSFVTRFWLQRQVSVSQTSFSTFVANLSIADFLMGVYLAMIGVADHLYRGEYLWYDEDWKTSPACKIAGFLSLLSSEVSALNICLITLDRFLVLRFPFSRVHFRKWSAIIACGISWAIGAALAAVPLLPMTSHWEFYSQNGICIPLPITRNDGRFQGHKYSFGIMIVLNFALFVLIAVGQVCVYVSIKTNTMSAAKKSRAREAAIAQRLATVVLSDFFCWFPIGLLGLLAATGTHISSEVNVGIAIFVLPFNSALNPFLYTFNIIWERRRKAMESRVMTKLESRYVSAMTPSVNNNMHDLSPSKESLFSLLGICLEKKVLTPEDVAAYMNLHLTTEFISNKEGLQDAAENATKEEAMKYVNVWLDKGILSSEELLGFGNKNNPA